ncbi:helix-turn-helix domain-containing protein [Streptomyces sp. ISL-100]|uniref:helix-turn-helix domain-containing protein n=1 Tax=Streptomyces sp. ISL-100 TaxID=2819173 RepID=UPI001BEB0A3B|nr:helix-turn-helix transcriptional regulator [Streptomyces sp. ISL-100]MBT2395352.1 helix-turn-helix transcriptional regulator [Streptomyces sp. ISL-100]
MPVDPPPAWVLAQRRTVGDRIRAARLDAQLSQVKLGELVGVDHKTIHRIEHGTSDPSLGVLLLIADAIGVPLADLVRH